MQYALMMESSHNLSGLCGNPDGSTQRNDLNLGEMCCIDSTSQCRTTVGAAGDLPAALDRAIVVHKQHVHGPAVSPPISSTNAPTARSITPSPSRSPSAVMELPKESPLTSVGPPLVTVRWEQHWEQPLDEVRARYGVVPCSAAGD